MNIELISAGAVQPNLGAAGVVFNGDSLTIKNAVQSKGVDILAIWQTNQVAGFGQVAFPSGHDTTRGYRAGTPVGVNPALLPFGNSMRVEPQELLNITIAGSNVAGDLEQMSMLIRYADLPGISARMIQPSSMLSRIENYTTIESSITATAGPGYSGEVALNAQTDLLKANRDYAVIGMSSRSQVHALTLRGPDIGNVRIGCPGVLRPEITSQWFAMLSRSHGEALVPVISSGNKNSTFVGVAADENAGTFLVTLYLALLR
jgi:hypothetical protein